MENLNLKRTWWRQPSSRRTGRWTPSQPKPNNLEARKRTSMQDSFDPQQEEEGPSQQLSHPKQHKEGRKPGMPSPRSPRKLPRSPKISPRRPNPPTPPSLSHRSWWRTTDTTSCYPNTGSPSPRSPRISPRRPRPPPPTSHRPRG